MGNVDSDHRRTVATDADQLSDDAGARISQALALRTRYRAQAWIAAGGATGAGALLLAWAIRVGG